MNRLFGTDGIRGIANTELTPDLAFNLGKVLTFFLSKDKEKPRFIIGKDTRLSGDLLESALGAGIMTMGGEVLKAGVIPTPGVAFLVRELGADAGIVISASHNSYEFNGIKIFNKDGLKLDDDLEDEIEDWLVRDMGVNQDILGQRLGRIIDIEDKAKSLYGEYLKTTISEDLSGLKIIVDAAHGAAYEIGEKVLRDLGGQVTVINNSPDGININAACGSTHPEELRERVVADKAHMGIAFDGDADRLIAIDEQGEIVDGDKMIYICAKSLKGEGRLKDNKVTATVMSNLGFHKALEKIGVTVDVTQVGDRYVLESMLATGCVLGGEQSGHIIFLEHGTTGDGILSALQLLTAVKKSGQKLSDLASELVVYPQVLVNAAIKNENKKKYTRDEEISEEIKKIEKIMAGEGRVLIRPSGTEPLVRVMIEGQDQEVISRLAKDLADLISRKMG